MVNQKLETVAENANAIMTTLQDKQKKTDRTENKVSGRESSKQNYNL